MIKSFKDRDTEAVFKRVRFARFRQIERSARKRLLYLDSASELRELAVIPGNRLEALRHDRTGQYSIRVNQQWRICFVWQKGNAHEVEIADYH